MKYSRGCFLFAQLAFAPRVARDVGAPEIRRQVAAGVRAAELQPRKAIERPVEDHPREENRRLERVADDVAEVAASAQRAVLEDVVGAARVHEDEHAELLGLRPERIELRRRGRLAGDVAGDADAAQPQLLDGFLELLDRQIGMLQRHRRQPDEAIRVGRAPLRELLVLNRDDPARQIAVGAVPPAALMAQRLHVDAPFVHQRGCGAGPRTSGPFRLLLMLPARFVSRRPPARSAR